MRFKRLLGRLKASGGAPAAPSAHPLTISATQRAWYDQMAADYAISPTHNWAAKWLAHVIDQATFATWSGPETNGFYDVGDVGAIAYQITGDTAIAATAYARIEDLMAVSITSWGTNEVRDIYPRMIFAYDWLYPALNTTQRTTLRNYIRSLLEKHMTFLTWIAPNLAIYQTDSDVVMEMFFGFQLHQLVIGDEDPAAMAIFADTNYTWGTLTPTASNHTSTLRNSVKAHLEHGLGGEWFEASAYNMGTVSSIMKGVHAIRTVRGSDDFSELGSGYFTNIAKSRLSQITPDIEKMIFWGDNEDGKYDVNARLFSVSLTFLEAVGMAEDATTAQQLQDLVREIDDTYTTVSAVQLAAMTGRAAYLYNPYITRGDYTTADRGYYSSGMGHLTFKSGYSKTLDGQFMANFYATPNGTKEFADHGMYGGFGHFELHRKEQFAITNPHGYGRFSIGPLDTNCVMFEGLGEIHAHGNTTGESIFKEYRKVQAYEFGDDYAYITGTQGGSREISGTWECEPTWVQEHSRSLFYLTSSDKSNDCVIVFDRTNVDNPADIAIAWANMTAEQQTTVTASKRRQWTFHLNTSPTVTGTTTKTATWTSAGAQASTLVALLPATPAYAIVNETTDSRYGTSGDPIATDRGYSLEITETTTDSKWLTGLFVWSVRDSGSLPAPTLINDAENVQGLVLSRTGLDDVVVLFNSTQGSDHAALVSGTTYDAANQTLLDNVRWRTTPFTVSFTTTTTNARVFLMDLKPSLTWTYTLNGGGSTAMGESSAGIGIIELTSAGAYTIAVSVS